MHDILFLSHCVPNPPNKGEKIRAFYELNFLASRYRVHLACLAKSPREIDEAAVLRDRCASVFVLPPQGRLGWMTRAGLALAGGSSLSLAYYRRRALSDYVRSLAARVPLAASAVYSSAMAQYSPPGLPMLLDMVDVDSEKWMQYGRTRSPGLLYNLEGRRLRAAEGAAAERAVCTIFATPAEQRLFQELFPRCRTAAMENGVDGDFFDPARTAAANPAGELVGFSGVMDYYPNADAAIWFAENVLPELRRRRPNAGFLIIGRNPPRNVQALARIPGVTVTGEVPDVRPYLNSLAAAVIPLRIARGIQNKVLEALAMGKPVAASPAVGRTFGEVLPLGLEICETPAEYAATLARMLEGRHAPAPEVRAAACRRFSWEQNLPILKTELDQAIASGSCPNR